MKNVSCLLLTVMLFMLASCSKKAVVSHGSWSMKGTNYNVTSCGYVDGVLYATDGSADTLLVGFANDLPPASSGSYQVVFTGPDAGQATVNAYFHGVYYLPSGDGAQTLQTTVSGGKTGVSGSYIQLLDPSHPSDTASIVFNVTQQ